MPAGRGRHGLGGGDGDPQVQRWDEVTDPAVQDMDGISRQGGEPGLGLGLEPGDGFQPAVLEDACRDHEQGHLAQ
jgi:hypothetical protein